MRRSSALSIAFLLILSLYGCYNSHKNGDDIDSGFGDDAAGESPINKEQDASVASDAKQEEPPLTPRCAWGVDAVLAEVGASAPGRINCGSEATWIIDDVRSAIDCFNRVVDSGVSVQITLNNCIDCWMPTTFVATAAGERFAIRMEADQKYGDDLREVWVKACDSIDASESYGEPNLSCVNERELYACTEPLSIDREAPPPLPVIPRKVADVAGGFETAILHLYVSNQSFDNPLVGIDVRINDTHVVTGDFDVGNQHNWIQFDLQVPVGVLDVYAEAFADNAWCDESFEAIVTGERWAVLEYWYSPSDGQDEQFIWYLSETAVAFE
jgi:hypothetical protein